MKRTAITLAALFVAGCAETPANEMNETPMISAEDEARLPALRKNYTELRQKRRTMSENPGEHTSLTQQIHVIEQEIKRIEPLHLDLAQGREDALDASFREKENTRRADGIINGSQ